MSPGFIITLAVASAQRERSQYHTVFRKQISAKENNICEILQRTHRLPLFSGIWCTKGAGGGARSRGKGKWGVKESSNPPYALCSLN